VADLDMQAPLIHVERLTKTFETDRAAVTALDDVGFTIQQGQFVSLVGPSGCGKSTLLNMIAGLDEPSAGAIRIEGRAVTGPDPKRVGLVFQESLLLPWKSAIENVEFPLVLNGTDRSQSRERAARQLDLVGLTDFVDAYPHELSVGMRQRVAIARGLVGEPSLLLMDEPFAALDAQSRSRMGQELLEIWERSRKTVLFVTHSLSEAIYLADRVLIMGPRPGRILESIDIPLARPRNLDMLGSEELGRIRNHIWHLIADDVSTGAPR